MKHLTPQEVYDLIRAGAASKGWQGFAQDIMKAMEIKNGECEEGYSNPTTTVVETSSRMEEGVLEV